MRALLRVQAYRAEAGPVEEFFREAGLLLDFEITGGLLSERAAGLWRLVGGHHSTGAPCRAVPAFQNLQEEMTRVRARRRWNSGDAAPPHGCAAALHGRGQESCSRRQRVGVPPPALHTHPCSWEGRILVQCLDSAGLCKSRVLEMEDRHS